MTSSLQNWSFVFMLPSFYVERRLKERNETFKLYHDTMYLGFSALDNEANYECSREYNSGWWYPHALQYDRDTFLTMEFCSYHPSNATNFNGVFGACAWHRIGKNSWISFWRRLFGSTRSIGTSSSRTCARKISTLHAYSQVQWGSLPLLPLTIRSTCRTRSDSKHRTQWGRDQ